MYQEKTEGFPVVHYPSLIEFPERRKFMNRQLDKYGINKSKLLLTDRYENIKQSYEVTAASDKHLAHGHPGNAISYLTLIKDWYETSQEEYGFFCDDDIDFSTIEHWDFTWKEFVASLPKDWECVQLIRIEEWESVGKDIEFLNVYGEKLNTSLTIRERKWCDFGTAFILKKSYAKKILERHYINEKTIKIIVDDGNFSYWPIIENILFKNLGKVYNFPLFLEDLYFESFLKKDSLLSETEWDRVRYPHTRSRKVYENLWNAHTMIRGIKTMPKLID